MTRRTFLGTAAAIGAAAQTAPFPIIDTHIHLFDTTRKEGVPWPPKDNAALYKPALPDRYRKLAAPFGIKGAIEVEASPWLEDNQWVLDIAAKDTLIVGTVGDLEPGKPDFRMQFDRFHKNPLFLGIRYGNLWDRDLAAEVGKPAFLADLKLVADAGMVLDTANPDVRLIDAVVRLTDRLPSLRVVVDHLPQLNPPADRASYDANLRRLAQRKQVYVKISQIFQKEGGRAIEDAAHYKPRLDELFGLFGEDRVIFGSDWPNSDNWVSYDKVFRLVFDYFMAKGRRVAEKYFYRNSVAAYRWKPRDASQAIP